MKSQRGWIDNVCFGVLGWSGCRKLAIEARLDPSNAGFQGRMGCEPEGHHSLAEEHMARFLGIHRGQSRFLFPSANPFESIGDAGGIACELDRGGIGEELPLAGRPGHTISNSDPITGQAGWYDVRVRLRPAAPEEPEESFPQVAAAPSPPGVAGRAAGVLAYFAGKRT